MKQVNSTIKTELEWRIISNPLRLNLQENNNIPLKVVSNDEKGVVLQSEETIISMTKCPDGGIYHRSGDHNDIIVKVDDVIREVSQVNTIEDIEGNNILKITFIKHG